MADFIFYVMSVGAVIAALGVVVARNPMGSVISLLASFFSLAVIYLVAGFQFMAAAQLLIYAGAILVLFLFVIMLLNLANEPDLDVADERLFAGRKLGVVFGIGGALLLMGLIAANSSEVLAAAPGAVVPTAAANPAPESVEGIAALMFSEYLLAFQATGLLLLATTVAVIVLAKRQRGAQS